MHEFVDIQNLTNCCFQSSNYSHNFPQIFNSQNENYFIFKKVNHKIVSFCTIYPTQFLVNNMNYVGYCIGSVCTHPEFRHKGFAQEILGQAHERVKLFQGDFVYLFSEKNSLYEKMGYQFYGQATIAEIFTAECINNNNSNVLPRSENSLLIEQFETSKVTDEKLITSIWNLIIQNSSLQESLLPYLEFKTILRIPNMQVFLLKENHILRGLCFVGKGDDFKNVVHSAYFENQRDFNLMLNKIFSQRNKEEHLFVYGDGSQIQKLVCEFQTIPVFYGKKISQEKEIPWEQLFPRSLQGT